MELDRTIVELIARNDGKWTWYQLERALASAGFGGSSHTMEAVGRLIKEGLLGEQRDARYPHPLYFITSKGKDFLAET